MKHFDVNKRAKFFATALFVAAITAAIVVVFAWLTELLYGMFCSRRELVILMPFAGFASYFVYKDLKLPYQTATGDVITNVHHGYDVPVSLALAIFLGSCFSIATGAPVGKEAAALQIGAALSSKLSRALKVASGYRSCIALAGMAAAIGVLFGTPFAAFFFVCELVAFRVKSLFQLVTILMAAILAKAFSMLAHIDSLACPIAFPQLSIQNFESLLVLCLLETAFCILFCILMTRGRKHCENSKIPRLVLILIASCVCIVVVFLFGAVDLMGPGMDQVHAALRGEVTTPVFLGKLLLTCLVLSCGLKGGEIMPMFCIGATLGCLFGSLFGLDPAWCAAVGLVAFMAGCTNCPIAALVFGLESFGIAGLPYFFVAAVCAFLLSAPFSLFGNYSFAHLAAGRYRRWKKLHSPLNFSVNRLS